MALAETAKTKWKTTSNPINKQSRYEESIKYSWPNLGDNGYCLLVKYYDKSMVSMNSEITDFISKQVSSDMGKQYEDFCNWIHNEEEYNQDLTSLVFSNLEFKKNLAKKIVRTLLYGESDGVEYYPLDARLRSLIKYYSAVEILGNPDLPEAQIRKFCNCKNTTWIKGRGIIDASEEAVVRMCPGDSLYQGYRLFIVNMLCFTADKFAIGFRTDNGPVRSPMKYYKGCKPLGRKQSVDGTEWNVILLDRSLSDDYLAVFSNQLDGEGTIEICDWLSYQNQRVIFRCDY